MCPYTALVKRRPPLVVRLLLASATAPQAAFPDGSMGPALHRPASCYINILSIQPAFMFIFVLLCRIDTFQPLIFAQRYSDMSHPALSDEKAVSGPQPGVPARDVDVAGTGDERMQAVGGEKGKIPLDDRKHPVTMDQASLPDGNEKRMLADEQLARQLQDEWDREGHQPSGFSSTALGGVTARDDKGRDQKQAAPYAPPPGNPPSSSNQYIQGSVHSRHTRSAGHARPHTNEVIEAGKLRAINEVSTYLSGSKRCDSRAKRA